VVTKQKALVMLGQGIFIAICSLLAFSLVLFREKESLGCARTAAFMVLACSQLFHSFNCRHAKESIFKIGLFTNRKLILAAFISLALQIATAYVPFLQKIFKTEPLRGFNWFLVLALSSFPLWATEIVKWVKRKKGKDLLRKGRYYDS
jgi:Ca2+-transporting ATPase